jgi:hypothetical protein
MFQLTNGDRVSSTTNKSVSLSSPANSTYALVYLGKAPKCNGVSRLNRCVTTDC